MEGAAAGGWATGCDGRHAWRLVGRQQGAGERAFRHLFRSWRRPGDRGAVVNHTSRRSAFLMENCVESPATSPNASKRSGWKLPC